MKQKQGIKEEVKGDVTVEVVLGSLCRIIVFKTIYLGSKIHV